MMTSVFLFGAVCSEEGYEIGVRMKKKHLGWSFVKKRGPETAKKIFFLEKRGAAKTQKGNRHLFRANRQNSTHWFLWRISNRQNSHLNRQNSTPQPPKLNPSTAKIQTSDRQNSNDLGGNRQICYARSSGISLISSIQGLKICGVL